MAIPIAAAMAASAAAPIIGGIIGNEQARGDQRAARRLQREALARMDALDLPEYQDQGYVDLESLDAISPYEAATERALAQDPSAMTGISLDPTTRQAQMAALAQLAEISDGGMRAQDRAALSAMQKDVAMRQRGAREALMQDMQSRGMQGSGLELAAQLANAQAGSSEANQRGLEQQAMYQQAALQALADQGQLGGQIRGQDFSQEAQRAKAVDAINRFNTQNRRQIQTSNVDRTNDAQRFNQDLQARQIAQRNQNRMVNQVDRVQANNQNRAREFSDAYQRASGASGQIGQIAQGRLSDAQATRDMWAGIGSGIGQGAASYGQYQAGKNQADADRELKKELARR